MLFLFLAILSSTLVSLFMRLSEGHTRNTMVMFFCNYAACAAVGRYYMGTQPLLPTGADGVFAVVLGIFGGVLFLVSLALYRLNIRKNGVVISALFMKLGVLVPTAMAMVFFHETPGILQLLGFGLAVAAILVLNLGGTAEKTAAAGGMLLILLLLIGGLADSLTNVYDKLGNPLWKDPFLFYIFLSAGIICLTAALIRQEPFRGGDILFGLLVGVPNYFSTRFLLLALGSVPAIVAYPVYNVSTIVVLSLAGVLFFREHLSRRKLLGLAMILLALVLLNL